MSSSARPSGGARGVIRNETEHSSEQNLCCFVRSAVAHSMQVFGIAVASLAMPALARGAPKKATEVGAPRRDFLREPAQASRRRFEQLDAKIGASSRDGWSAAG
jgi:hypothetical protein